MNNKEINKEWLIGYLAGLVYGISMRSDVPKDIKQFCKEAYKTYEDFYNV